MSIEMAFTRIVAENLPKIISLLPAIPILLRVTIDLTNGIKAIRDIHSIAIVPDGENKIIVKSGADKVQTKLSDDRILQVTDYKPGHGTSQATGNAIVEIIETDGHIHERPINLFKPNAEEFIDDGITAIYQ